MAPPGRPEIVVGGPGTGKTQFLVERVAAGVHAGIDPSQVMVLTFSRSGVNDLRMRLATAIGPAAYRINVATYHSIATRLVEAHANDLGWASPPAILTSNEQEGIVADLLATEDPSSWPAIYRPLLPTETMAAEVTDFILRMYEQLATADTVAAAHRPQWRALPGFVDRYEATLRSLGRIDYGRVLADAVRLLEEVGDATPDYRLVVADEYQDTSPAQARLLFSLAAHTDDLVVAADPYQSIYSFRGADINNVFRFPEAVAEAKGVEPATRIVLTTSHRVPEEILDAAVAVTARELPGGAGKVLSTRTGGSVASHTFATPGSEAEWIAADIERIHLTESVPLERIAVFTRGHGPFVEDLTRALERRGIVHTQAEERLVDEPSIRFIHDLVRTAVGSAADLDVAGGDDEADAALRRVLLGPYVRMGQGAVSSLPDDLDDRMRWLVDRDLGPIADLLEDPSWAVDQPASSGLWHVWSSLPQLAAIAVEPEFVDDRRVWSAYAQVLNRIGQRAPGMTLAEHAALSSRFDFEADVLFSVHDAAGVTIATLHRAKGTEYDVGYIADAVEGALPDLRARDSVLGVRHLNPNLPTDTADYITFRLDEERRLAYTAMTRSTSRVVWTATVATDEGGGRSPSRFLRLVAPITPPASNDVPLTPRAMLADLRKTLADPSRSAVERLAALAFLADHGDDPLDRYGVRDRGSDTGVTPAEIRLSPSQATSYRQCPRKYAIERYVMSQLEESVYMRLGNLVHTVLETVERTAILDGRERASLDEALSELERAWTTDGLGEDSVALAWKRRAATLLTNLYEHWPSSARPIDVELELTLDVDGIPWRGRADRIERSGERITVVDYKSGNPTSVDEAARSIQLAYYVLAASEHPAISAHGSVDGAEFWYPKKLLKGGISTRTFDMDNLDDVRSEMADIGHRIAAEQFPPTPGDGCRTCPVISSCPAMPNGEEAFLP